MKKILAIICAVAIALSAAIIPAFAENEGFEKAADAVKNMRVGWNLGNTLDSFGAWIKQSTQSRPVDYETAWNNPVTTNEIIAMVKDAGFGAVRVPVTYSQHVDAEGNIETAWLDREEEIVNYVLNNGMYCIINMHHDTGTDGWLHATKTGYDETAAKFAKMWKQIAERFSGYGDKLLFEGFNEILDENNEWNTPKQDAYDIVNSLNQLFVDTVRATGGNNAERNIVVTTYAAAHNSAVLRGFVLPTDTADGHLIAEVHSYSPWNFTSTTATWTKMTDKWTQQLAAEIAQTYKSISTRFSTDNVPVIVGEFGSEDKSNTADRAQWAKCVVAQAAKNGVVCFYWDTGTFRLLDRDNMVLLYPEIVTAIIEAAK
ncbi:MAG: glycoside hydrolase family 5 protein [Eubacteriales bacterium]|nr:glycoside hydrolase family 5 protein [Eubacteriales bacterium]MDD3883083.1 glycoside hydrolase family 5 protein [Eubacteriales bacterium]MDD4512608.1 glycoside hydrolase family 5 protein [Eubacteriales bacterium]